MRTADVIFGWEDQAGELQETSDFARARDGAAVAGRSEMYVFGYGGVMQVISVSPASPEQIEVIKASFHEREIDDADTIMSIEDTSRREAMMNGYWSRVAVELTVNFRTPEGTVVPATSFATYDSDHEDEQLAAHEQCVRACAESLAMSGVTVEAILSRLG